MPYLACINQVVFKGGKEPETHRLYRYRNWTESGKILVIGGVKGVGRLQFNGWLRQVSLWVGICLRSQYLQSWFEIHSKCTHWCLHWWYQYNWYVVSFSAFFPAKPYHKLLKDDKLQTEDTNNPLNDSIKARDLFFDEIATFQQADASFAVLDERPGG